MLLGLNEPEHYQKEKVPRTLDENLLGARVARFFFFFLPYFVVSGG